MNIRKTYLKALPAVPESRDWKGDKHGVFVTLGSSNHAKEARAEHDYYATDPAVVEQLLDMEGFAPRIWECACGEGHISKVLARRGYEVRSTDLIDRGFGTGGVDFLKETEPFNGDIITNPPFSMVCDFVCHALDLIPEGNRAAFLLRLNCLEGAERYLRLFSLGYLQRVYVAAKRAHCAKNGAFDTMAGSAQAYAWFIFRKGGDSREPVIRWFNIPQPRPQSAPPRPDGLVQSELPF